MAAADVDVNLENLLRQIATEQGFKKYNLQITPISTGGANYSSTLYTAKVEDDENVINLFTKVALITREALAAMGFEDKSVYNGEIYFYSDVCKLYKKIEDKHNIWTKKDRYILPKYYGASMEISNEMLVLEDLAAKGFTTYDRFKSVDWPYASSAVKELAKFHALSMAFEKENPQMYKSFVDKYKIQAYNEDIFKSVFIPSFNLSVAAVREENREKLKKFLDNITHADIVKVYQPENMKVLVHSDFRPSNLMHRYREDGTIQVIPVDYQTFQDGCPVSDLMYFIFLGSDEAFRRQYYDKLLDHYYTELTAAMARLGLDKSLYSRKDFNHDLKEKLKYGLLMAAQLLPTITVDPKEAPTVTEGMTAFAQIKTSEALVGRINGVVNDYIKWGIL